MKLLALSIDGFRGIQHAIIRFGEHDVLVGPNGSGKSTIIDALSLVFGRTRLVRDLTEHDFYGSCPEATSRIRIVATLGGWVVPYPSGGTQSQASNPRCCAPSWRSRLASSSKNLSSSRFITSTMMTPSRIRSWAT